MQELRDPIFLSVEFSNIKKGDKKPPQITVKVNLMHDDLIYVASRKSRMEVIGYTNEQTGLFVAELPDGGNISVYGKFRQEAVRYASEELLSFLTSLEALTEEEYNKRGYLPFPMLANGLRRCLTDRQELYANLQKQVNLLVSKKLPKVNEYLAFADDTDLDFPVTERLPYKNPKNRVLSMEETALVDRFLDVFFDEYHKMAFAWYLGAALLNVPIYDDRVSKLAILSSTYGGSGKSTLANAMVNALFTPAYRDVRDNFDRIFIANNRFGTAFLSTRRITIYSEASWNVDPLSEDHNFDGLNVSAIKSLITEGYVTSEMKFEEQNMERLSGFHLVLTNYPPSVTKDNEAMNRRILPLMLHPTSMGDKAKELGLFGRQRFDAYVKEHAELFAAYFAQAFLSEPYRFFETDYDYRDYVQEIKDAGEYLEEAEREGRKKLDVLKADGFVQFLSGLEKMHHLNLDVLKQDVLLVLSGGEQDALSEHIKRANGKLFLDASKSFLLRYGGQSALLRKEIAAHYGDPVKKCHKRMFEIPM